MIYLVRTKARGGYYYKVGFASDFSKRWKSYITHNPIIEPLEGVMTYGKTKRALETEVHHEILKKGYEFHMNHGIKTEWFFVKGKESIHLEDFSCCKGRKVFNLNEKIW